jgi:iron-regulated transporter 1
MWDMGIVLLIAEITNNSLSLVALAGLCNNLFLVMFMTTLGKWLDRTNRLTAAVSALSVKLVTLSLAYSICYYVASLQQADAYVHPGLIYSLPILSAVASLSFNTISQSVEKDWIVVLSNGDSLWLATTNAIMTQIDSGVNSFAPPITGFLFLYFRPSNAAIILLGINALASVLLYFFMNSLYNSWPSLAADRGVSRVEGNEEERSRLTDDKITGSSSAKIQNNGNKWCFTDFMNSGCAGAMIAYAFLFMTVLSYGSLMTVYLRWSGMSDGMVGLLRGGAAFSGLMGAVLFPFFNHCFGLYYASAISIVYQFLLVGFAAASFFLYDNQQTVWILAFAVVSCDICDVCSNYEFSFLSCCPELGCGCLILVFVRLLKKQFLKTAEVGD